MGYALTTIVADFVGALVSTPPNLKAYIMNIRIKFNIASLQKSALLGSAHIL